MAADLLPLLTQSTDGMPTYGVRTHADPRRPFGATCVT